MKRHNIILRASGFSLIELMVVVVIVAVLAAIALPSYERYTVRSARSQAQAEMLKIAEQLENYRGKQLSYAGFKPEYQYGAQTGIVNIPHDTTSNYKYQIQLVDSADPTKTVEQAVTGQGWKMIATPQQNASATLKASESLMLSSLGVRCMTSTLLTVSDDDCGSGSNTKPWD